MDWEGFVPDMNDKEYLSQLKSRMQDRVSFVQKLAEVKGGYDKLPEDALASIEKVLKECE